MKQCSAEFFFSSRRRHTRYIGDWSSDVCSSDLISVRLNFAYSRGDTLAFASASGMCGIAVIFRSMSASVCASPPQIGRASCRERMMLLLKQKLQKLQKERLKNMRNRLQRLTKQQ